MFRQRAHDEWADVLNRMPDQAISSPLDRPLDIGAAPSFDGVLTDIDTILQASNVRQLLETVKAGQLARGYEDALRWAFVGDQPPAEPDLRAWSEQELKTRYSEEQSHRALVARATESVRRDEVLAASLRRLRFLLQLRALLVAQGHGPEVDSALPSG
jgi:hypothetical protein